MSTADQRQAERNFVAHHLRRGAQAGQHRILAVRRPSSQRHAVNADRGDAQNDQQPDVDVGDLQGVDDATHLIQGPIGITAIEVSAVIKAMTGASYV